jgi:hypothetical protein
VLVDGRDHAYLADFGLTKSGDARGLTRTGTYVGSLDYVAPELVRGEPVTAASDRYALTAVLYECLAGEVPFPRETEAALLYAHVSEPPPRPSERRRGLSSALDPVVARGLAKDPADRYATAGEIVGAAAAALELGHAAPAGARRRFGETIVDPGLRRRAPVIALEPTRKRPGAPLLAALALVCAGLAAAGFLLGHSWTRVRHPALGVAVAGPIALSFPTPDWRPVAARPVRRLHLLNPVALAGQGRARDAAIVAGFEPKVDARTLLPFTPAKKTRRSRVALDHYEALRYRGRTETVYAVPVGLGAATVVCTSPTGRRGAEARARCENVATTLAMHGVSAGTIGPDPRYAAFLHGVVRRLGTVRRSERRALASARTPGERAGHAELLASSLANAAAQLDGVDTGPRETPLRRRLARALASARDAYVSLAASLRAGDRTGYLGAASRIRAAEAAADASIRGLARLGYPLP